MSELKLAASKLKKNKTNAKWLIVEIMKISNIDFDIDHASFEMYKYGFGAVERNLFKWMMQLCDSCILIFNGYKPEKVNGKTVGFTPVFGLIKH